MISFIRSLENMAMNPTTRTFIRYNDVFAGSYKENDWFGLYIGFRDKINGKTVSRKLYSSSAVYESHQKAKDVAEYLIGAIQNE
jgi:hypothetical protein